MMLHAILHELEAASGPVTTRELSHKLGIQPGALAGMIQFWVAKGRLRQDEDPQTTILCARTDCAGTCPGPARCPLVSKPPTAFTLSSPSHTRKTP